MEGLGLSCDDCLDSDSRAAACGFGAPAEWYAVKGFRHDLVFCAAGVGGVAFGGEFRLGESMPLRGGRGLAVRVEGIESWSRTLTKFEGNCPTMRRSLLSLPVHQEPSPAFKHSM